MLHHGHVALGFKLPAVGGCPEVRASEPAGETYPHNRFLYHVHVCTHARYTSKGQSPPCLSLTPSSQYGVTELALPPASSCHLQTYRRSLTCKPVPECIDPVVSKSIQTPACSRVNPRGGFRNLGGQRLHCPRRLGAWCPGSSVSLQLTLFSLFSAKGEVPLIVHPPCCFPGLVEPPSPQ